MKTLFLSLNSQYVHTLLAPRYLCANAVGQNIEILETNVNVNIDTLLQQIYCARPDTLAISCYIFNISVVRKILDEIKLFLPNLTIILGGYEVTFDIETYLPLCDYIIKGEGDFVFGQLLDSIERGDNKFDKVIEAGSVAHLDDIARPYTPDYAALGKDKILYMETSRGCPYHCSYCMSANSHGVRTFSLERTFADFEALMEYDPRQIKLVDRTFNFDIKRANKIFSFLIDKYNDRNTNFHFELAPELFDDEIFATLQRARKGLFQFEIGVQSYNKDTLALVGRSANVSKIESNITRLVALGNSHIHVDLIAGLPDENKESFVRGFDRLFLLKAENLQLGFLKILKGSNMYNQRAGYVVRTAPPYEIVSSPQLSYDEIVELKRAESALETYHNSGRFARAIEMLVPQYFAPYEFFLGLGEFVEQCRGEHKAMSASAQCDVLYEFVEKNLRGDDKEEILTTLVDEINADFAASGNVRKWKRVGEKSSK
ncbi:MAG: DUF4080 domain-containing protein [Clostridia bacterium]